MIEDNGKVYMSGYPRGVLFEYDPTKEMGGISKPFLNYAIQHLTPVNGGDYIAIATVAVTSQDGFKPKTSKIFIFNTKTKKL